VVDIISIKKLFMQKNYLLTIILILCCFSSQAQWTQKLFNNANVTVLKRVNNVCFAYGIDNSFQGKLYRSDNNGGVWTAIDSVTFKFIYINDITYDSLHNKYVICTYAGNGIFTSVDGNTWASTGANWSGDAITYIGGRLVLSLATSPDLGIAVSTDAGNSFSPSNSGLVYPFYAHHVTRIDNSLYIYLQAFAPCYISTDVGTNWFPRSNGLSYAPNCFYKFANKVFTGTEGGHVYVYNINFIDNQSWNRTDKGLPKTSNINALTSKRDTLFCGGDTIGVWMRVDNLWTNFSSGLPQKITVNKLLIAGRYLFAATKNGLWKIKLSSETFDEPETTNIALEKNSVNDIKIFPTITPGKLTIQSPSIPASIMLTNANGQLLKQWSNTSEINISDVYPGNYFITININGKLFMQQVIKTN